MREDEQQPEERDEREASVLSAREAMWLISPDPATAVPDEEGGGSADSRNENGSGEDTSSSST